MTRYCAVIGNPVSHSQSPKIHQEFAEQLGIDLIYDKLESTDQLFQYTVREFFAQGGCGLNVTIPFKTLAYEMAEQLTDEANKAGSVNTLYKNNQGELCGDTTDGRGLLQDLENNNIELAERPVLILGAGGAARSIIPILLQHNANLFLLNRTVENAEVLIEKFAEDGEINLAKKGDRSYHLIINTMPQDGEKWLEKYQLDWLAHSHIYDISYGVRAEKFLHWCDRRKAKTKHDGWGMLVEQAALSFEIWHGKKPETSKLIERGRR